MKLFNKTTASILIGLTALGGGAAVVPALAGAQEADTPAPAEETVRPERGERLQSLVESGTISQAQADEIQERFGDRAERRGNRQANRTERVETLTEAIGISAEDLIDGRQAGQSLAEIAEANGVSAQTVIDTIVAEKTARIEAKVADGTIDADTAADKLADLEETVTEKVNSTDSGKRGHRGHRGFGGGGADTDAVDA